MALPNYILQRFSKPGGVRLAKKEEYVPIAGICPICLRNVIWRKYVSGGAEQVDGVYQNGVYYHWQCRPSTYEVYGPPKVDDAKVPAGNLDNEEYRYWVGGPQEDYVFAMCRACKKCKYGKPERQQHFKDPDFLVNGDPCTTQLVNAYKYLMESKLCLVCKQNRYNRSRWGVPLCEQPECLRKWKFSTDKYIALEFQLELQRKKQAFHDRKAAGTLHSPKMGEFTVLPSDKPTRLPWCKYCQMFTDNTIHAEIHMDKIGRGEIIED